MSYDPDSQYTSPYPFELHDGTEIDVAATQLKLSQWHAGEPISLNGGVVIGTIAPNGSFADLLDNLHGAYAQISLPGSNIETGVSEKRFQLLDPKAKAVIYGVHAAFRELVRLDTVRSGLPAPNANIGMTSIGMFNGEDDWHCDGWQSAATETDRYDQMFGNGIIRYGVSLGAPGTVLLAGTLRRNQIVDGFLLDKSSVSNAAALQRQTHTAGEVVRFVSDYDVHRAPRFQTAIGRYFTSASAVLPLTQASRA